MSGKKTKPQNRKSDHRIKQKVTANNIFEELGLDQPDELLIRANLLNQVSSLIKESGLSQEDVAVKLGITQPQVSLLVGGRLSAFSTDILLQYLSLLGCNVSIKVSRPRSTKGIFREKGKIAVRSTRPRAKAKSKSSKKPHSIRRRTRSTVA